MATPAASLTGSRVLDDLAEVVGEEAAFALASEFMGERVYIPKDPDVEPRIAEAIGADQARHLCDAFWRTVVTFPSKIVIERRVVQLAEQNITKREIARRLKIRQARVFAILARERDKRQLSLF
jgi:hypothetical protein